MARKYFVDELEREDPTPGKAPNRLAFTVPGAGIFVSKLKPANEDDHRGSGRVD